MIYTNMLFIIGMSLLQFVCFAAPGRSMPLDSDDITTSSIQIEISDEEVWSVVVYHLGELILRLEANHIPSSKAVNINFDHPAKLLTKMPTDTYYAIVEAAHRRDLLLLLEFARNKIIIFNGNILFPNFSLRWRDIFRIKDIKVNASEVIFDSEYIKYMNEDYFSTSTCRTAIRECFVFSDNATTNTIVLHPGESIMPVNVFDLYR